MTTLTLVEEQIRQELIDFVKIGDNNNSFARYKPLAGKVGVPYGNEYERDLFHAMLGNVSQYEFENGRPMLSVVVVTEDLIPGRGFFKLARELGKQKPDIDDDTFAVRERKDLFEYWKNNEDPDR